MTDTDKQNSTVGKRQTRYSSTKQTTQYTAKHKTKLLTTLGQEKNEVGLFYNAPEAERGHTMS